MARKYWVGCSDEHDHKPTDFETYIVINEDDLLDAQASIAEWVANDYLEGLDNDDADLA